MSYNELFVEYDIPETLSEKDLLSLFIKMKSGDTYSRELIIKHSIRFVILGVLKYFHNTPYEKKELVAIGLIGLIKSVDTFDISKNIKFSTYASKCIINEINMFLRKEKKYFYIESIDKPIRVGEDENKYNLSDILFDVNSDFVSKYENEEINAIIRQIVENLPFRDKEVISLYFGFIDNKPLSQIEIAERLGLSQPSISRIISKTLKRLEREFYEFGICESSNHDLFEKKEINIIPRKLKSIYEYFEDYKREQIDEVLSRLTDDEKRLIVLRYGDDLDNPVISPKWTIEHQEKFYGSLVPKIKRRLSNTIDKTYSKVSNKTEIQQQKTTFGIDKRQEKPTVATGDMKEGPIIDTSINSLETKNIYKKIKKMSLNSKEEVIIALKFGFVDGKHYSTEFIANFLGIEELEVIDLTKKVLSFYKDKMNQLLDTPIDVATEETIILEYKNKKH